MHYAGKVGSGFHDGFLRSFRETLDGLAQKTSPFVEDVDAKDATFVRSELVGKVGFTEWTTGGKLRHPRFLGLRDDKPATEVKREAGAVR
ncbi:hypothetical protein [Yoonia sp.]|uniref:ATP dependent DNA ligase n=1 Tax=Yoonia sp. TaxID=2212373 RepID=UPI0025EE2D91|nr:hypothetical protein [Yoonia sp.]